MSRPKAGPLSTFQRSTYKGLPGGLESMNFTRTHVCSAIPGLVTTTANAVTANAKTGLRMKSSPKIV